MQTDRQTGERAGQILLIIRRLSSYGEERARMLVWTLKCVTHTCVKEETHGQCELCYVGHHRQSNVSSARAKGKDSFGQMRADSLRNAGFV